MDLWRRNPASRETVRWLLRDSPHGQAEEARLALKTLEAEAAAGEKAQAKTDGKDAP
jgi:hypothetical protein